MTGDRKFIVFGPSCAGKTTLIDRIKKGEFRPLCEQLGIHNPLLWSYIEARDIPGVQQSFMERVVLHYDIYKQYSERNGFSYLSELINKSNKISVVTLCASPAILLQRNRLRINNISYLLSLESPKHQALNRRLQWLLKKHRVYKQSLGVLGLFDNWFDFCNLHFATTTHWIVDSDKPNMVARPLKMVKSNRLPHLKDAMIYI